MAILPFSFFSCINQTLKTKQTRKERACIDFTECVKQTTLRRAESQSGLANPHVTLCSPNNHWSKQHVLVKLKSARQFEDFLVSNGPTSIFRQEGKDDLIPTGKDKSQFKILKIGYIPLEAEIEEVIKKLGEYGLDGVFSMGK
jgi:hypothetical protein